MQLRGIDFEPVWCASGAQGFFGEGYWFHQNPLLNMHGETFVAKTITVPALVGNMPIDVHTWQPLKWFPGCIKFKFWSGVGLNAVGLTNFGFKAALDTGRWRNRTEPFMLSYMPQGKTLEEKLADARMFVKLLQSFIDGFLAKIALQVNLSCPNTGENLAELVREAVEILKVLRELNIPLVPKFNTLTSPETIIELDEQVPIDAVCVSNTIPYGERSVSINWSRYFGDTSPLAHLGGGGLSGAPIFDVVRQWMERAQTIQFPIPVNWCGGLMSVKNVETAFSYPVVKSISLGTVHMLRPWRVQPMIKAAYRLAA